MRAAHLYLLGKEEDMKRSIIIFKKVTIVIILILLGCTISCQHQRATMQTEKDMNILVDRIRALSKTGNMDLLDEVYASDMIYHGPDGHPDPQPGHGLSRGNGDTRHHNKTRSH